MTPEESKQRICKNCKHYGDFELNGVGVRHICRRSTRGRESDDKSRGAFVILAVIVDENDTCDHFE